MTGVEFLLKICYLEGRFDKARASRKGRFCYKYMSNKLAWILLIGLLWLLLIIHPVWAELTPQATPLTYADQFIGEIAIPPPPIPLPIGEAYVVAIYVPPKTPKIAFSETIRCSCVNYVKFKTGAPLNEVWGRAEQIVATSSVPRIGGVVLTTEGPDGHAAYIENIVGNTLLLSESNYEPCEVSTRSLSVDALVIRGYK